MFYDTILLRYILSLTVYILITPTFHVHRTRFPGSIFQVSDRKEACFISRTARFLASGNYYHVITKGNGQQILFETNDDYLYYLYLLKKYSEETQVKICVYCLMSNHTHFLVYDEEKNLPTMMHKLGIAYAIYYNRKYKHSGHVFQNRFKSVIIEDERQFMLTCKYILYNPEKAGICDHSLYQWSSFSEYHVITDFPDSESIYKFFANEQTFYEFLASPDDDSVEYEKFEKSDVAQKDDQWAQEVLCNLLGIESGTHLQTLSKNKRDAALHLLKKAGLGIRQIERLTGISRSVIQRA